MPEMFPGDGDPTTIVLSEVLKRNMPGAASDMANGGPVQPIDFAGQLMQHKDKITKLLTSDRPSSDTVTRAIARAVGGKSTYGEAMNTLRASERASASNLYNMLDRERSSQRDERRLNIQESHNSLSQLKLMVEMGNQPAKIFDGELTRFVTQPRDKLAILNYMDKNKQRYGQITLANAAQMARQLASDAFSEGVITGSPPPSGGSEFERLSAIPEGQRTPEQQQRVQRMLGAGGAGGSIEIPTPDGPIKIDLSGMAKNQQGKVVEDLKKTELAGRRVIETANSIQQQLASSPSTGVFGRVIRGLDNMVDQLAQVSETYGYKVDRGLADPANYNLSGLGEMAKGSAVFQSNLVKLAYVVARLQNGPGPLSKGDVQDALQRIGAAGSRGQLAAVLEDVKGDAQKELDILYKTWSPDSKAPVIYERKAGASQPKPPAEMSDEELLRQLGAQ